ncbi:hypothetical protein QTP88_018190 [Uroleucon formosanum]
MDVVEVADAEPVSAVANVVGSKKADYKSGFDGQIFVNYSDLQQRLPRATETLANVKHLCSSSPLPSLSKDRFTGAAAGLSSGPNERTASPPLSHPFVDDDSPPPLHTFTISTRTNRSPQYLSPVFPPPDMPPYATDARRRRRASDLFHNYYTCGKSKLVPLTARSPTAVSYSGYTRGFNEWTPTVSYMRYARTSG